MSGLEKSKQVGSTGFTVAGTTTSSDDSPKSHVHLRRPSWSLIGSTTKKDIQQDTPQKGAVPSERSSMRKAREKMASTVAQDDEEMEDAVKEEDDSHEPDSDFVDGEGGSDAEFKDEGDSSEAPEGLEEEDDDDYKLIDDTEDDKKPKRKVNGGAAYKFLCEDDGDEMHYQKRLFEWARKRRHLRWRVQHVRGIVSGCKYFYLEL